MKIKQSKDILAIYTWKKQFAKICKNLARYKSENIVGTLNSYISRTLALITKQKVLIF